MGEAGCTGALPALTNAVLDALRAVGTAGTAGTAGTEGTLDVGYLNMPLTPAKIWAAIREAKS